MSTLAPLDPRTALRAAGLMPKRSWGQNFLCAPGVLARLVAAVARCGPATSPLLELGAGTGALTAALWPSPGGIVAVERDRELAQVLRQRFAGLAGLVVLEADAARLEVAACTAACGLEGRARVVGNLPYQLASRILVHLAGQAEAVAGGVFMVQKEVGERLTAAPGSRAFSLLSVLVQRAFCLEPLFDVSPGAFFPRPRITSQVVGLTPRPRRAAGDDRALVAAARLAFSARRRTVARALADRLGVARDLAAASVSEADVDPRARAESLDLPAFARLGAALAARGWLAAGPAGG